MRTSPSHLRLAPCRAETPLHIARCPAKPPQARGGLLPSSSARPAVRITPLPMSARRAAVNGPRRGAWGGRGDAWPPSHPLESSARAPAPRCLLLPALGWAPSPPRAVGWVWASGGELCPARAATSSRKRSHDTRTLRNSGEQEPSSDPRLRTKQRWRCRGTGAQPAPGTSWGQEQRWGPTARPQHPNPPPGSLQSPAGARPGEVLRNSGQE